MGARRDDDCPYQRVEYIENTKDARIICDGYVLSGTDNDIYFDFTLLGYYGAVGYTAWFSSVVDEKHGAYRIIRANNDNSVYLQFDMPSLPESDATKFNVSKNTRYKVYFRHDRTYKINDISGILAGSHDVNENTGCIKFYVNLVDSASNSLGRIHSFKWVKGGIVKLDLIPIRIGNDGYLYDKVSGKIFGNANNNSGRLIAGPDVGKPYDKEVEYLECNEEGGICSLLIDGYIPNGDGIDIDCSFTFFGYNTSDDYIPWFDSRSVTSNESRYAITKGTTGGSILIYHNNSYISNVNKAVTPNTKYDITLRHDGIGIINGSTFTLNQGRATMPNTSPIWIFSKRNYPGECLYGRIHYFKLTDNGELKLDLIPVRKRGVGYLYDRVSGNLYGNLESGHFILGPDK